MEYAAYIVSPAWKMLRAAAIARDGGRCRLCDSSYRLTVHHRRYPPIWAQDCLDNLTTLCFTCHGYIEPRARRARKAAKRVKAVVPRSAKQRTKAPSARRYIRT